MHTATNFVRGYGRAGPPPGSLPARIRWIVKMESCCRYDTHTVTPLF